MRRSVLPRNLGISFGLAAITLCVAVPTLVIPLASYRAGAVAEAAALRTVQQVDGALERGERADVLADRIGAVAGHRVIVVNREGQVIGDTARDGAALERPLPEDLRAFASEVRARGSVTKRLTTHHGVRAIAGVERGRGLVLLAFRPLEGITAGFGAIRAASTWGALALAGLTMVFSLALTFLLRPARELGEVARALARGNFSVRAESERDDELGELGRAIDGMADELRARVGLLATEEARLATVLDSMVEAVFVTDAGLRIAISNSALRRLAPGGMTGRTPIEAIRSPELHRAVGEAQGGQATSVEFELRVGDDLRMIAATVAPMPRGGGVVVVMHDVTRLKEIDRIRRDFVANASHELRTPLTAIRGYAETLRDGAYKDPTSAERFLDVILRHTIRLQRLVDDLIALSRAESPESRMDMVDVDAEVLVREVVDGLETNAAQKKITMRVALPAPMPRVRSNDAALDQILVNLVDNAIKYSPEGAEVRVSAEVTGGSVVFQVWNSGPPIAQQHLERLFERFYRVDPGRSRDVGGTGLGLSIVKHLGHRIGAEVSVESAKDQGTSFRVKVPLAESKDEPARASVEPP